MVAVVVDDDVDDIVEGSVVNAAVGGKLNDIIIKRLRIHQVVCVQQKSPQK